MSRFARLGTLVGTLTLLVSTVVPAHAQPRPQSKIGAFAGFEIAQSTEDEGSLGSGPGVLGGITYRWTPSTAVGVELGVEQHVRDFTFLTAVPGQFAPVPYDVQWSGKAVFLLATIQHAFGERRTRPFVYGGIGLMHDGGTTHRITDRSQVPTGVLLPDQDFKSATANVRALDGGAGVEIALHDRLSLRPFGGLRLTSAGETGPKYIVRGGVTLAF